METSEVEPAENVGFPSLDDNNFFSSWPVHGVLHQRAVLAAELGLPALLLSSSLREQATYRAGQARRRCERAARYRPALRASATAVLTASMTRDTGSVLDPATPGQAHFVSAFSMGDSVGCNPDSEGLGQDGGAGVGSSVTVASPPCSSPGPKPALTAPKNHMDMPSRHVQQQQTSTLTSDATSEAGPLTAAPPSAPFPSPPSPSRNRPGSPAQSAPPPVGPLRPGTGQTTVEADTRSSAVGVPPETSLRRAAPELQPQPGPGPPSVCDSPDLALRREALDWVLDATEAAYSTLRKAGKVQMRGGTGATDRCSPSEGGGGFRGKLQQNDAQELYEETEAALEKLREAVVQLPAHQVVWHLEQATAHARARDKAEKGQGEAARPTDDPALDAPQLWLYVLALLRAHVILSRHPRPSPARVTAATADATTQTQIRNDDGKCCRLEREREHHRRAALLLMEGLLLATGRSLLPYPELAALAVAQAELCPLLQLDVSSPPGHGGADSPACRRVPLPDCLNEGDFPLRLVKRCVAALATHTRLKAKARSGTSPTAQQPPSKGGPPAVAKDDLDDDDDDDGDCPSCLSGGGQLPPRNRRRHEPGLRPEGVMEPHGGWLGTSLRPLEELVAAAARAHVAAVVAAAERCAHGFQRAAAAALAAATSAGGVSASALNVTRVFRGEYEEVLRRNDGLKAEAAVAGCRKRGGDAKKQAAAVAAAAAEEADGDLLRTVLVDLPRLVNWDHGTDGCKSGSSGGPEDRPAVQDPNESRLVVGLTLGRALGLWPTDGGGGGSGAASGTAVYASGPGEAALRRMELSQRVLEVAAFQRPSRLAIAGAAALRSVVAATCAVGLMRQTSRPHPDAVCPSARKSPRTGGDGPLLLRFELTAADRGRRSGLMHDAGGGGAAAFAPAATAPVPPDMSSRALALARRVVLGRGGIDGTAAGTGCPAAEKGSTALGKGEAVADVVPWMAEEFLGQLAVTVVARGAAAGQAVRQICKVARRRLKRSGDIIIEVPPAGFSSHSSGSGTGNGGGAGRLELYKQQLLSSLSDAGCAWLHCADREALQAAALLLAEVHEDLQQQQQQLGHQPGARARKGSGGAGTSTHGRAAPAPVPPRGPPAPAPGPLEVLPYVGGPWWELHVQQARGRVMRDLHTVMWSPTQLQPQAQAQTEGPSEPQADAQGLPTPAAGAEPATGSASAGGGDRAMLCCGWEAVQRLALNREACNLIGLMDGSLGGLVALRPTSVSSEPAAPSGSAAAAVGAPAAACGSPARDLADSSAGATSAVPSAALQGGLDSPPQLLTIGPDAVSLLVLRQKDLDVVDGVRTVK
ncbi:hypothetical protein PLESTB_001409500 [Pleodorina starrii]|uniref:Uncharacterized protein n=1 Tax=Pleodorina starrii TaxID=330485 RepID=A0A9W6BWK0_9CHLO|nr:hypothetical protein PLESTB_001409500 [Pleodorina starrii]GLC68046.1 hypothetical protein PLESTF_000639100 [Pleodorina starrii]